MLLSVNGKSVEVRIPDDWIDDIWSSAATPTSALVSAKGVVFEIGQHNPRADGHHSAHDGDILSPMPGRIIAVEVAAGDTVTKGQKLLTLEAMKMEHSLTAPFDGVVAELNAEVGAQVQVEALLVRIEAADKE